MDTEEYTILEKRSERGVHSVNFRNCHRQPSIFTGNINAEPNTLRVEGSALTIDRREVSSLWRGTIQSHNCAIRFPIDSTQVCTKCQGFYKLVQFCMR
jgi:hypothetical protein